MSSPGRKAERDGGREASAGKLDSVVGVAPNLTDLASSPAPAPRRPNMERNVLTIEGASLPAAGAAAARDRNRRARKV